MAASPDFHPDGGFGEWDNETDEILAKGVNVPEITEEDKEYLRKEDRHDTVTFAIVYALGAAAGAGALMWKHRKKRSGDVSTD